MNRRRVVITGLGVLACNGIGRDKFWQANRQGRSGIGKITCFDTEALDVHIGGEIRDFDPSQFMPAEVAKKVDRFVHFGLACSEMAIQDSQLDLTKQDKHRIGVVIGSGLGGMMFHEEQMVAILEKGVNRINPSSVPRISPNAVSSQ